MRRKNSTAKHFSYDESCSSVDNFDEETGSEAQKNGQ